MAKNLYSVTRFTTNHSVTNEEPYLATDYLAVLRTYEAFIRPEEFSQPIELKVGQSHVIAIESDGIKVLRGLRITRRPDFAMNSVVFDSHAKEYVLVTNGKCVLNHSSVDAYKESHGLGDCVYAPSEAIALRPVIANGKVLLAYTYRAVNPCYLEAPEDAEAIRETFKAVLSKRRGARYIGRI